MKIALIALLVGVCGLALAIPTRIPVPTQSVYHGVHGKIADQVILQRQKDLLRLLRHVHQPNSYKDQVEIANTFDIEANEGLFTKPIVVKEFIHLYRIGLLPHKEIFSVYNEVHRRQVIALFHLMYYANTYETFYKVCCWARQYVNPGMYVYALTVAVLHRPDCRGLVLPAPYEIYPYYFVNHEVIKKAQEFKMQNWAYLKPEVQQRLVNILDHAKNYKPEIYQDKSYISGYKSDIYQGKDYIQRPYYGDNVQDQQYYRDVPYYGQQYQQYPYKSSSYYSQRPSFVKDYILPYVNKNYYEQTPYYGERSSVYGQKSIYGQQTPYVQKSSIYGQYPSYKSYDYVPKYYESQVYQGKPYYGQKQYESYEQNPYTPYEHKQYESYEQKQYTPYEHKQYESYEQKPFTSYEQQVYGPYEQKQYVPYEQQLYGHYEQKPYVSYVQKPFVSYGQKSYDSYERKPFVNFQSEQYEGQYVSQDYVQKPYVKSQYYEKTPYTSYVQKPYYHGQVPSYEQYPYADLIHTVEDGIDVVYIPANYTTYRYANLDQEQYALSYFTEDIGLNSYYFYFHADYPFWMTGAEYGLNKDRRGELFYYTHQQLLARYYLERLSNGLGEIPWVNIDEPIEHVCTLQYENGLPFPMRPAQADLIYDDYTKYTYERLNILEKRILEAIDLGYVLDVSGNKVPIYTKEGTEILGNLIQGNADSVNRRYYGHLIKWAKILLGYSGKPLDNYKLQPSTLELYETALRDPMFYRIYKRIVEYFLYYKKNLPSYTYNDLVYQGVKIDSVNVDQLITYFDYFNIELNNALYNDYTVESDVPKVLVKARQLRLNHKPFTYKINVSSDKTSKVVVRLYLGPKYDSYGNLINIAENRINFVELDKFVYDLQSGQNVIERDSRDFHHIVQDRTSYFDLYKRVMLGLQGSEPFVLDNSEAHCGFPQRLLLPKGSESGVQYQVLVVITPFEGSYSELQDEEFWYTCGVGSGARYIDNLPLGYPLDREIVDESQFYVPNLYFQDVVIYHHGIVEDVNLSTVVPRVPVRY